MPQKRSRICDHTAGRSGRKRRGKREECAAFPSLSMAISMLLQCETCLFAVRKHRYCRVKAQLLRGESIAFAGQNDNGCCGVFVICLYSDRQKNGRELRICSRFVVRKQILHSCKAGTGQESISVEACLSHDGERGERRWAAGAILLIFSTFS